MKIRFIILMFFSLFVFNAMALERINLAVVGFYNHNNSSDKKWIGPGFTETLTERLSKLQDINVMDRESLRPVMDEIGIKSGCEFEFSRGQTLGKTLGVNYLITGYVEESNKNVTVVYQLFDVNTGGIVAEESLKGNIDKIFALQGELSEKIAAYFNIPLSEKAKKDLYFIPTQSLTSLQKFSEGIRLYEENRISEAYSFFLKSIKQDMSFLEAHRYFQYSARKTGKLNDFIKNYESMLKSEPKNPILMNYLGNAYLDKGNFAKAESLYKKAIQIAPAFGNPHNNLAAIYVFNKKYNEALSEFNKGLQYSDKKAPVYYNMGLCYLTMGDKEQAKNCFTQALEIDNKNPDFVVARFVLYGVKVVVTSRDKKVPGEVFGEILLNSEPLFELQTSAGGFSAGSRAKIIAGRLQFMINDNLQPYEIEIGKMNNQVVIQTSSGKLIMTITQDIADREGTTREELAYIKAEILRKILNTSAAVSYTTGGYVLQGSGKKDNIKDMEGASQSSCYLHKGDAYYNIGEMDKALAQYKKALENNPSYSPAYFCTGIIYFNKKDYKNALNCFNNAVKYNPKYVKAYIWLGKAYTISGNKKEAKTAFSKALKLEPDNSEAKACLKKL